MLGKRPPGDEQILRMMQNGDQHALVLLYKQHAGAVQRYILRNSGSREDAEDLLQEALVVAWQNAQKPDFRLTSRWGTYLTAICKNLWLKQLKKNSRFTDEAQVSPEKMSEPENSSRTMDLKKIVACVEQLDETCRKLLTLFYFEGLDMEQIALRVGFNNADTAKAKKYQCFKRLEQRVKQQYDRSDFLG
jgi:RNA polymerase sigma factor (sigma-70 family)